MDLETDTSLMVDISDALSEQDKVKFTVHTKVDPIIGAPTWCNKIPFFSDNTQGF